MAITLYLEDAEIELPCKWAICPDCEGNGSSSAYLGAITQSDREPGGDWEDPEDFEDYMQGGYDRACDTCHGSGKVQVADRDRMTKEQNAAYDAQLNDDAEMDALYAAERRMGA